MYVPVNGVLVVNNSQLQSDVTAGRAILYSPNNSMAVKRTFPVPLTVLMIVILIAAIATWIKF